MDDHTIREKLFDRIANVQLACASPMFATEERKDPAHIRAAFLEGCAALGLKEIDRLSFAAGIYLFSQALGQLEVENNPDASLLSFIPLAQVLINANEVAMAFLGRV